MSGVRYPFGTDAALILDETGQLDIDTTFAVITDVARVLLADLLKIITTLSGALWWAPTATEDVTQLQNDAISPDRLAAARHRLQSAIEQDPRFEDVTVTTERSGRSLRIAIEARAVNRTLRLVLVVNDDGTLSVEERTADGNIL